MKVSEAKTNADMRRTKLALEHGSAMQELESRHRAEVAALGSKLESVMLSRQPADSDPIDEFLESMRPPPKSGQTGPQPAAGKKHDNFARIQELEDEIRAQENLAGELSAKIQNILKNPPEIERDAEIETGPSRESLRADHKQKMNNLEE
jgi:hypothetical protein